MGRITLGDKASRVLKMLIGMRTPRVAAAMVAYGFSDAELQEGWQLLQDVSRVKLDATKTGTMSMTTLAELDGWENRWFPVASATLERRFPAVHAQVFKNLSQQTGAAVAVSVRSFVERYDAMAAGQGTYGAEGTQAKAVLDARGLTAAVVNEARALLETVGKVETLQTASAEDDKKKFDKAEADLWAWYLEWSQIARVAISQRALLKQMGLLNPRAAKASAAAEDDEESDDADETDARDETGARDERVVVDPTTGIIRMAPAVKSNGAAARA
jgi:hypothetical protein